MSKVVFLAGSVLLVAGVAFAGIVNPCGSPVIPHLTGTPCYFACPQGDTGGIASAGFWFEFTIRDFTGNPVAHIPEHDFWLIDCDPSRNLTLCGGSASSNADSATNALGKTTMSVTTLAVGGCATGLSPVVQGVVLREPSPLPCTTPIYCFNIKVRSCDLNGDLVINISDAAILASHYPPMTYDQCSDFNCDGHVNLSEVARFAAHYGPPGHKCP
jgi:hypothetical protein